MLDDTDRRLLRTLQNYPDLNAQDLAERVGCTTATASRRLDRLRESKVLTGQHAVINWARLGYTVEVSLRFTLDKTAPRAFDEFLTEARKIPEVVEIQTFLGRVDVRLAVVARDLAHYQRLYRERILMLPHIAEIEALMDVAVIKSDERLPI
ncbi:MAG: Lrp/AsnC family transcriptional regulator [Deltaproteobacteria bacterium]